MDPGALASAAATSWARLATLEGWSALGQAVGGFATAAAVVFAAYEILWRRRADRLSERRGDAAAAALVALAGGSRSVIGRCLLLQETIRNGLVEDVDALSVATQGAAFFAKSEEWLFIRLPDEMYDARLKTTAILSDEESAPLDELSEQANLLLNELSGRFGRLRPITVPAEIKAQLAAMNASLEEWAGKFHAIETRGRAILGPIAQLRVAHG